MFTHHCAACDRRMLVFPSQITELTHTDHGIVVAYRCWCGSSQSWSPAASQDRLAAA